jgi:glycosyltransferase involved in cell wall biosynthesis
MASRRTADQLSTFVRANSIKNLLVIPVSPWILAAALRIHRQQKDLNLVLFVMDDWQGHHESYDLPYSNRRRRLLGETIRRATKRFAVSREMAAHYEESFGGTWQIAHNGIDQELVSPNGKLVSQPRKILLAGDINVFRFDAVFAFAKALQRYSQRTAATVELTLLGDVAHEYAEPFSRLGVVRLLGRRSHSDCLEAMRDTDLVYLPLAFSKKATRISLYSLPTKLPEYLASGKTMLVHAPRESAVFSLAERYDLNPRLATIDDRELDRFIEQWAEGKLNDSHNEDGVKRALSTEFNLRKLAANFQAAFV